jgi:hypothetical protein
MGWNISFAGELVKLNGGLISVKSEPQGSALVMRPSRRQPTPWLSAHRA